ncbi:hypothetical protein G4B88_018771 [Cannabis sativa]|uniref:Uncharacterized protein n=1 Tax=Cannabis sativa TaxID=3483 RepID=A0A7J6I005_CANSA|nr:hypothetical protein G4B88_018771 [Cannabis sativa]
MASLTSAWSEYLNLESIGLHGIFPENIFHFPNLQELYLSENYNLTGSFPRSNWTSKLKILDLSSTQFSIDLAHLTKNSRNLNTLLLRECKFIGSYPILLGDFTQIIALDLSANNFHGQVPWYSLNFKGITSLDLSSNNFQGELPESYVVPLQLTSLDLGTLLGLEPIHNPFLFVGSVFNRKDNLSRLIASKGVSKRYLNGFSHASFKVEFRNRVIITIEFIVILPLETTIFERNFLSWNIPVSSIQLLLRGSRRVLKIIDMKQRTDSTRLQFKLLNALLHKLTPPSQEMAPLFLCTKSLLIKLFILKYSKDIHILVWIPQLIFLQQPLHEFLLSLLPFRFQHIRVSIPQLIFLLLLLLPSLPFPSLQHFLPLPSHPSLALLLSYKHCCQEWLLPISPSNQSKPSSQTP